MAEHFHVPSPARDTEAWVAALRRSSRKKRVDLIVPVYEEAFHLAKAIGNIPDAPPLFAPDFETLIRLHDKWRFNQTARAFGLSRPETVLLTSREELVREFTRDPQPRVQARLFAVCRLRAAVKPASLEAFDGIEPTPRRPWVSQAFLPGRPYATFSIAHRGRLTAHVTYATDFSHDLGPTVVYRRADHPAVDEWVRTLVKSLNSPDKSASTSSKTKTEKSRRSSVTRGSRGSLSPQGQPAIRRRLPESGSRVAHGGP